MPVADVVFITGTALLNDTLGELVALARPFARIGVVGPTATMVPGAFRRTAMSGV
ncbi:MAG: Rossmann-like domain-containing protein [Geminicoccaceae bacterium]